MRRQEAVRVSVLGTLTALIPLINDYVRLPGVTSWSFAIPQSSARAQSTVSKLGPHNTTTQFIATKPPPVS